MDAKNGIQQFLIGLFTAEKIDRQDIERAIEIAKKFSPSAAFSQAKLYCRLYKGSPIWDLGFAKGVRWLAILRRDSTPSEFENYLKNFQAQLKLTPKPWVLADGAEVRDRQDSHLQTHAQAYPALLAALPEAFSKINPQGRDFIAEEADMGRVIGNSILVATSDQDEIVYAQRLNRVGLTRFVKNREAEPCRHIVVLLKKAQEGFYILLTAFVGKLVPNEPWDENAEPESVPFWNTHALIWGHEETVPGTETSDCPWGQGGADEL